MSRHNPYFKDELEFLNEIRDRAAREHWDIARFLAVRGSDPDVERLFEGFAFLTGRLRQKLDDEFPELVQSVLGLWWPHYLRAVPSLSIVEFSPILAAFAESKTVAAGTELQSRPIDGGRCRFRTAWDTVLHPLTLESAELDDAGSGAELRLDLALWPNASFAPAVRDGLRLYLADSHERACDLLRHLCEHTARVDARLTKEDETVAERTLGGDCVRPVGYGSDGSVLPDTSVVTPGHLRLQEYFSLPEKYLFVELTGLSELSELAETQRADRLELRIRMRRPLDWDFTRARDPVRLNCVPIANVFKGDAKPILLDDRNSEYRLVAEATAGMRCELYAVDSVHGLTPRAEEPREYYRFESFDHQRHDGPAPYYRVSSRPRTGSEGVHTTIAFLDPTEQAFSRRGETISFDVRCTNGNQPRLLDPGDICVGTSSSPEYASFANLTRPTQYVPPPLDGRLLWRLVSNVAQNYSTMLDAATLRNVIETYDFRGRVDGPAGRRTRRILDGLQVERSEAADRLVKGLPLRGVASEISVSRSAFRSLGEAYLFGCVLRNFLASFAPINSFHQLTYRDRDSDEVFEWPSRQGSGQIL